MRLTRPMKVILTTTIMVLFAAFGVLVYNSELAIAQSSETKPPAEISEKPQNNTENEPPAEKQPETAKKNEEEFGKIPAVYEKYAEVLATYVDENGGVDYAKLRRKRNDLSDAMRDIAGVTPLEYMNWGDNEKKAFWINAHNLFTLKLIIDNYPIKARWYMINYPANCIMQIAEGRNDVLFDILGLEYKISEIEDERLLDQFDDLRVIFALTYASKSSPFLRNEPYTAEMLDKQLDDQTSKFLASPIGMKIGENNELYISGIFSWYRKNFVDSKYSQIKKFRDNSDYNRAYLNFIIEHVDEKTVSVLESRNFTVRSLPYDWNLNETENK